MLVKWKLGVLIENICNIISTVTFGVEQLNLWITAGHGNVKFVQVLINRNVDNLQLECFINVRTYVNLYRS